LVTVCRYVSLQWSPAHRDLHSFPTRRSSDLTTTKEATAAALGARYRVLRSAASFNNEIGVPMTFLGIEPSHEVAVVEIGFYVPGDRKSTRLNSSHSQISYAVFCLKKKKKYKK